MRLPQCCCPASAAGQPLQVGPPAWLRARGERLLLGLQRQRCCTAAAWRLLHAVLMLQFLQHAWQEQWGPQEPLAEQAVEGWPPFD